MQWSAGLPLGEGHGEDHYRTRYGPGTRCRAAKSVRYAAREPDSARAERSAVHRQPGRLGFVALHPRHSRVRHGKNWGSTIGMPLSVKKKLLSGKAFSWGYEFAIGPRGDRQRYKQGGFATRTEAINAESAKRLEIERGEKINDTGTLGAAIEKFFADRGETMSPKTLDRYRELADYLS